MGFADEQTVTGGKPKVNQKQIDAEEAAMDRVNTILGRNPTPGVGAPGSTPQTNTANASMATSMERSDRGGRFGFGSQEYAQNTDTPVSPEADDSGGIDIGFVNQRRNQILQNIDPDAPAIFPNAKRKQAMQHELGVLTDMVREDSLTRSKASHDALLKHRDITVSDQSDNIFKGLLDITPDGSPESQKAVLALINKNRLAVDVSPAVRAELKRHADVNDRLITPIAPQVDPTTGLAWNGSRWVSPPKSPNGKPMADKLPSTALTRYAKLQGEISLHEADSEAERKQLVDAGEKGTENTPYSKSKEWAAAQKELSILEKAYPILKTATQGDNNTETPNPDSIREQFRTGKLTKEQAADLLKKQHGFE